MAHLKQSRNQYRNINGIHFEFWAADGYSFKEERKKAKALGLKTRTIDGQLYREKK